MRRRTATALLAAAGCVSLMLSGVVPVWVAPLCLLGLAFRVLVLDPHGRCLLDLPLTLLHTALLAAAFALALLREPPMPLLDVLLICAGPFLLLCCLAQGSIFNDFLILLVSVLAAVGSAAVATGLVPLWITLLYLLTVCQALPALAPAEAPPRTTTRVRLRGASGRWRWAPRIATHHVALLGLLLGGLLYLVLPRPSTMMSVESDEAAARLRERRARREGASRGLETSLRRSFPAEMRIGDLGRIKRSDAVAFEAQVSLEQRPYDPAPEEAALLLLRARGWERYDAAAGRWLASAGPLRPLADSGRIEPGSGPFDWTVDHVEYAGRTLFLPQRARRVRSPAARLFVDRVGDVQASEAVDRYGVEAARPVLGGSELARLRPDYRQRHLLEVPRALATALRQIAPRRTGPSIAESVDAVRAFFTQQEFRYTLDLPDSLPDGQDPVLAFLERGEGHCELYATAACLLLRTLGVPARVAGGMRCAERIGPGRFRVRFRNAHAWVEVACLGVGFVAFDFTPPDREAAGPGGAAMAAALGIEADELAGATGASAALDWGNPFDYGPLQRARVVRWLGRRVGSTPVRLLLGVALALLLAWVTLAAVRRRGRGPLHVRAPRGVPLRTLAFYAAWLRRCAGRGHLRRRSQTPREFLAGLPADLKAEGAELTARFERLRYGAGG